MASTEFFGVPPGSHPATWACRSCRAPLGEVRGGVLRPAVPVGSVDGRGVARVPCPRCGRVRRWVPGGAPPADDGSTRRARRALPANDV
jgi:hypothetical protein